MAKHLGTATTTPSTFPLRRVEDVGFYSIPLEGRRRDITILTVVPEYTDSDPTVRYEAWSLADWIRATTDRAYTQAMGDVYTNPIVSEAYARLPRQTDEPDFSSIVGKDLWAHLGEVEIREPELTAFNFKCAIL